MNTIAMLCKPSSSLWQLTKLKESALTPWVHQGSVVGLIEPLRGGGSGSVLSLICQVAQCVLINNNCLPLFKLFLKLTFFSLRVFSINYFLANFPISSYFYIISLSQFNLWLYVFAFVFLDFFTTLNLPFLPILIAIW